MKRKKINSIRWTSALLLISMILVGCAISQQNASEDKTERNAVADITLADVPVLPSATQVPSATPTVTASHTPTPEPFVTLPSTSTVTPSSAPMATSTPTPTLTPLPTIPPQQRGKVYNELMRDNGGCVLPCWWGFELGKTSAGEVRQFYTSFETFIAEQKGVDGRSALYVTFVDPQIEGGEQMRHLFRVQDGIITEAEVELGIQPHYQIVPILERLGQPNEVWLWTIPDTYEGVLPVSLLLFFPERGVLVSYAVFGKRIDDKVRVCFDDNGSTILRLWEPSIWDPKRDKGFIERANESSELTVEGHRPLAEVSNWDVEQFYTILTDPTPSECLETPSNLWPLP